MAGLRGTSRRTVANQLAAVFRKLNLSGRSALRAKAIREYASQRAALPLALPSVASRTAPLLSPVLSRAAGSQVAPGWQQAL